MKLHALLSFYDEQPADLQRLIASLPTAGVTSLIALDGAYSLFPDAKARSAPEQHAAIINACTEHHLDLLLEHPDTPWAGNETEKRSALFAAADTRARPNVDWYMVMDADETVQAAPDDLHQQLASTPFHVGEVTFSEPRPGRPKPKTFPIPILFRAIPGIQVVGNHYTYRTPDGTNLWGNAISHRLAPRIPLHSLVIDHFTHYRTRPRRTQARRYYRDRDNQQVELGNCTICKQAKAARTVQTNWRPSTTHHNRLVADYTEICNGCYPDVHALNVAALAAHGLDPNNVTVQHGIGAAA